MKYISYILFFVGFLMFFGTAGALEIGNLDVGFISVTALFVYLLLAALGARGINHLESKKKRSKYKNSKNKIPLRYADL